MYKVYDDYDLTMELIGEAKDLKEVKKIAKERYYENDGECAIYYGESKTNVKFLKKF